MWIVVDEYLALETIPSVGLYLVIDVVILVPALLLVRPRRVEQQAHQV